MAMATLEFLRGKNVLIVGATGFLGKVFVEKILRVQPDVGCIFTLIRSKNVHSAQAKLQNQVISKQLFGLLRERYKGESYQEFMARKLDPVVGDVALNDLGIEEILRDELCAKIHIVIKAAATTNFYERYDIAMEVNAFGSRNIINFCKRCSNLQLLCHISTAYVNGGSTGVVREEVVRMEQRLSYRMMDPFIIGYGKGRISSFLADHHLVLDVIPVDMVVNCMMASIARHASEPGLFLYHVASSLANPLHYNVVADVSYNYFSSHPCTTKKGKIVRAKKPHFFRKHVQLQTLHDSILQTASPGIN